MNGRSSAARCMGWIAVLTLSLGMAMTASAAAAPSESVPSSGQAAASGSADDGASIEARLDAARERLEQAAREVAELSGQAGSAAGDRLMFFSNGVPPRAVIGVQLEPGGKEGARVREVSPGGPAEQAGIRAGDVIVAVNGEVLKEGDAARETVSRLRRVDPDDTVKIRVLRDGDPRDFEVKARASARFGFATPAIPGPPVAPGPPGVPAPPFMSAMPHTFAFTRALHDEIGGMELATMTPGLGRYFGTDKGVLVLRAPRGDAFKLEEGDVILSIDGRRPENGSHATRILRSYQPGEKLNLQIMRQHKEMKVEGTLPAPVPGDIAFRATFGNES